MCVPNSKNYQNFWGDRINKKEQLSYSEQLQILNGFGITNWWSKQDLNLIWIFKGTNPFGKNLNNLPKNSLGMIFNNINLDGITYIQKFEDPLQVANELKLRIQKDLNLNLNW
jgi:hypothetical protein